MELLLDTHVVLWSLYEPDRISPELKAILSHVDSVLYLSDASSWEMLDKAAKGKLPLAGRDPQMILQRVKDFGLLSIHITEQDIARSVVLPLHHRDPFDRMLIAQAIRRGLTLVTKDEAMSLYAVSTLWT